MVAVFVMAKISEAPVKMTLSALPAKGPLPVLFTTVNSEPQVRGMQLKPVGRDNPCFFVSVILCHLPTLISCMWTAGVTCGKNTQRVMNDIRNLFKIFDYKCLTYGPHVEYHISKLMSFKR